jgi:hypothetical protein
MKIKILLAGIFISGGLLAPGGSVASDGPNQSTDLRFVLAWPFGMPDPNQFSPNEINEQIATSTRSLVKSHGIEMCEYYTQLSIGVRVLDESISAVNSFTTAVNGYLRDNQSNKEVLLERLDIAQRCLYNVEYFINTRNDVLEQILEIYKSTCQTFLTYKLTFESSIINKITKNAENTKYNINNSISDGNEAQGIRELQSILDMQAQDFPSSLRHVHQITQERLRREASELSPDKIHALLAHSTKRFAHHLVNAIQEIIRTIELIGDVIDYKGTVPSALKDLRTQKETLVAELWFSSLLKRISMLC